MAGPPSAPPNGDDGHENSGIISPPHHDDDADDVQPPYFPLWNRLVLSLLGMALLWASSLRTAGASWLGFFGCQPLIKTP